ncbi:S8 family serine peptidase [Ruminiclostridium herbifermentans]|uniref:S8 family serine peptidase n=1 Tax=Ruminiclostridium herbifermentans TaxID=2488810 RepID=A0A4U7JEY6_9FIRM|nr:S8 family serine peptidase [Ruminiclostridium herbifermentans]QNU67330.1 S8 family serine peptidase [Ruminiclostridium herbifermentans]
MKEYSTNIAIIDDGINQNLYSIGELKHNIQITPELHIKERVNYDPFLPSHGTTCAAIIKKYAPDAVLSSVKILNDDSHKGMRSQLIKALEWCVENNISLINLSLGTIDYKDFIEVEKATKYASNNGVIIVAACNNRNVFTCPASLENVVGVKCDRSGTLIEMEYIYNSFSLDGIDITACGIHDLMKYSGEIEITSPCNSFAAPAVTALICNIIKDNPNIGISRLKEALKRNATNIIQIEEVSYIENKVNIGNCFNNSTNKSIEIPIIEVYNNYSNKVYDFYKKLTAKFREDGYNAISICTEAEKDLCNGLISINSGLIDDEIPLDNNFLVNRIKMICDIYDPDIIIVPIDMMKDNYYTNLEAVESDLEIDIKININENLDIEVMSENEKYEDCEIYPNNKYIETKTFTFNDQQIDHLYNYILSLFETNEGKIDTYEF